MPASVLSPGGRCTAFCCVGKLIVEMEVTSSPARTSLPPTWSKLVLLWGVPLRRRKRYGVIPRATDDSSRKGACAMGEGKVYKAKQLLGSVVRWDGEPRVPRLQQRWCMLYFILYIYGAQYFIPGTRMSAFVNTLLQTFV